MDSAEDSIGSARPPRPPRPHNPERAKVLLLQLIAVAAVATAAFTGITAWETHEDRMRSKAFYCTFATDGDTDGPGSDPGQKRLFEQLGC
jgi:hypothetical protein